ncbi:Ig-like domain-containing protein [Ruegeria sp.]|uniref:Ig-like domain-containing protein n=1 Tax=Ruegeria sp. TaxID=1879320 RepID=UPI003B00A984
MSLRTLDGVKSIEVLPDGTAEVTLENGAVMRLPAGSFTVSGSEVLVSEAVALQMTEAAAAGGGVSGGTLAAVGGGLALAGAAGGGGGGGGSSDGGGSGSTTAPTTGTVVDGYLVNATVFQDLNGNAIFDAGEPNTTTDAQGNYSITLDPSNPTAKIVSIGGTDSSTGQAFTGTLTAPAGSTVITPLTTLVQSLVEASADSDTPLTAAEANEQLAAALGLGSDTNLLELDPVEEIENASDPSDAAAFAAAAQVAAIISAAAATQSDAQGSSDASEAVAASLAQQLLDAAAGPGDPDPSSVLSDADAIAEALEEAEVEAGEASAIANGVQALNENIDEAVENADPGDLDALQNEIVANQEVAQGTLVDLVESGDIATTDPADLADEADNIVPLEPVVLSEDFLSTYGPSNLDSAPVMSGTGRPGSIVRVTFSDGDDATPDASRTTTVDGAGNWLFMFDAADFPAASGAYTVEVAAAPSGSSVFTVPAVSGGSFDVDLTPPAAPVLGTVSSDDALALEERESDLTVSGTAEVGATVAVTIGGVTRTDNAAADGSFSVTFDASDIPDSDFTITAEAVDSLGNTSDASDRDIMVEPEVNLDPTIDPVSGTLGSAELASGLTVTGTGRAGSTITVSIDGEYQSATVGGDGTWSVTFAEADLPDASGNYTVSAVATLPPTSFTSGPVDGGGFSVDLTAPDSPSLDTIAGNNALELEEQGADLTITGTAEAGATVEVTLNGVVETVVADAGGAFSVTFSAADVPGTDFSVSATATDPLGNASSAATQPIMVEPVSALTPTITPVSGTFGPTELAAGLVVSGTGRVGSTVTVDIDGVTQDATVDGDGNWTATFAEADLPDATGDYTVSATATLAGTSFSSGSVSGGGFSVDLDAAAAPVLDVVAGNNAIELEESGLDLTVTGTTDEGATVEVTIGGVTLTDVAGVGGVFSVTFDATDVPTSDFSISAVASDDLGNSSASATQSISVEPESALTPTVDPVSGVLSADDLAAGLTVTGTGRIGSTVTVSIDGEDQEAVVDGDGNWSVTFAEADLPATTGDYPVSAVATLPPTAFTSGSVDGGGFSVDVTAPDAPVIDSVAGDNALDLEEQGADLTITGSAEAFASVEVEGV